MSVSIIERACDAIAKHDRQRADKVLAEVPISQRPNQGRAHIEEEEVLKVFKRDRFICRYTAEKLVFGGALRLFSEILLTQFPYDSH